METEIIRVWNVNWDIWDKISDELFGFQQRKSYLSRFKAHIWSQEFGNLMLQQNIIPWYIIFVILNTCPINNVSML